MILQLSGKHTQVSAIREATSNVPFRPELTLVFHDGTKTVTLEVKWNEDLKHYILA
jgi:hypothetical protein